MNCAFQRNWRRWLAAQTLHWLLLPFGYLELTDVYKIELTKLPPLFEVPGYTIEKADAAHPQCHEERNPDVLIVEPHPEQRRNERGDQDDQPAEDRC